MTDLVYERFVRLHEPKLPFGSVVAVSYHHFFFSSSHWLIHFNKLEPLEREHVNLNVVDDSQSPWQAEGEPALGSINSL